MFDPMDVKEDLFMSQLNLETITAAVTAIPGDETASPAKLTAMNAVVAANTNNEIRQALHDQRVELGNIDFGAHINDETVLTDVEAGNIKAAIQAKLVLVNIAKNTALNNNLLAREPLAVGAGVGVKLSQPTVDAIAKAKTGRDLKAALTAANPGAGILPHAIAGISDGPINDDVHNVNAPLVALRKAATKQALIKHMDHPKDPRLVSAIARAKEGPGGIPPLADAIRTAIKDTPALASFSTESLVLDDAAALTVQEHAIAKHNELTLSRVIDRVLDDKTLLEEFTAAPNHAARRDILNHAKNKLKFGINLCVVDETNPASPFNVANLPDTALDKVMESAEMKVRELANPAALDRRELHQRLNVAIAGGTTKYGYECRHVTDPAEIRKALAGDMKAAGGAGGAAIRSDPERIEESVKANDVTTWVKSAETQNAGPRLNVTVVRDPNGNIKTTNSTAELAKLTSEEKQYLAKQMAQEYIANMIKGREIFISCGDKELGNMIYAALLVIQMEAKKACAAPRYKLLEPIVKTRIFPPSDIESLHDSWDMTKKKFIKKHFGESQSQEKIAKEIAIPAMESYLVTAEKLSSYDAAQEQLSKKTKELDALTSRGEKWYDRGSTFKDTMTTLRKEKSAAETAVAEAKAKILTSEVDNEGGKHQRGP